MPYTLENSSFTIDENKREQYIKEGKAAVKKAGDRLKLDIPRLADDAEYKKMHAYYILGPDGNELQKAEDCVVNKDYNKVDSLSYGALSYQCNKLFRQLRSEFKDDEITMENEGFRAYAEENLNNPFFRLTMEMAGNTPDLAPASLKNSFRQIGDRLNQLMMQKTVQPPTEQQKQNLVNELGEKDAAAALKKNRLEQLSIAKMMFMAHLGDFHTVGDSGLNKPYTGNVTEAFAHGGRTFFCFSKSAADEKVIENTVFRDVHPDNENKSVDHGSPLVSRIAGTHGVKNLEDAEGAGAFRETKTGGSTKGLHAMNPAIGGIGNEYGKRVMRNDGANGHVFVKIQEGTAEKGGYMMVGFEGESSLSTGKTGHWHVPTATKGKISAFGTGKGAPGAELGGRVVDLSIWKPDEFKAIMSKFNESYAKLQDECAAGNENSLAKMRTINEKLTGKVMDREKFVDFMKDDLGISMIQVGPENAPKPLEVNAMMNRRQISGKANFERMNERATANARQNAPTRADAADYALDNALAGLSVNLNNTVYKRMGKAQPDSNLMVNVKASVQAVLDMRNGQYTPQQMKLKLAQLKVDSGKYLKERKAKNDRRHYVQAINTFAKKEMEAIDEYLEKHPNAAQNDAGNLLR